ncbi:aldo/keto reductase [Plantactinospora sp. ZYX-F-223]|uniref:aldo/keto reductase n=1 Tax=Plantactinospora sp. ZYX-F-223 TaxID=3144103 RepID=UPI0031FBCAD5
MTVVMDRLAGGLGLGLAPIGKVGDAPWRQTLHRAWELGVRLFDTAPLYGAGRAEERAGAALADRPRDDFVLSTKAGIGPDRTPDFSYDGVMRSVAASLRRLRTERIDILYIHDPQDHHAQAVDGAYRAAAELRAAGVVQAVGVGMNYADAAARFVRDTDLDCVLIAGRYTLLDRSAAAELLPLCAERGVAVVAAGVFNSGLLANPVPGATYDYRPAPATLLDRAVRLRAVCERHGLPLAAAALQFAARHPAITATLVGAATPDEIEQDVRWHRMAIPDRFWSDVASLDGDHQ